MTRLDCLKNSLYFRYELHHIRQVREGRTQDNYCQIYSLQWLLVGNAIVQSYEHVKVILSNTQ
ncbi:MAG: hypothetical protein OXH93_11030 [Caldilineaceae bacterium]|nr:hypothetical protein [Caldilineaceae bacterium]